MKNTKIIKKILILSFFLIILSTRAISLDSYDYYFENSDSVNDVFETSNESNLSTEHSFIDLIYAQVFDYGNRIDFTIKTKGDMLDSDGVSYGFIITSSEDKEYKIVYSNDIATFNNYLNCENVSYNETIIVTIPKDVISHITVPWNVSVYAKFYGNYKDTLYLEPIIFEYEEDDKDTEDQEDDNDNTATDNKDTPGFMITVIILSVSLIILTNKLKKKK